MEALKILVCEDEALFALELKERLERMGHSVVGTAVSGEEALTLAGQLKPDLVLMDVKLAGELSGTRLADVLQRTFHLPSIFLTAFSDAETVRQAHRAHPLGFLVKPIDDAESEYISGANLQNPRAVPDSFVVIEMHSTGRVMTSEELDHALRPVLLTDGDQHALSLALAVAHGVSQAHGGWLQIESKSGAGTSFKLFLPRVHAQ